MANYFISQDCKTHKVQTPLGRVERTYSDGLIRFIANGLDDQIKWKKVRGGESDIVLGITSNGELIEFGLSQRFRRYPNFYAERSWQRQGGDYVRDIHDNLENKFINFGYPPTDGDTWVDIAIGTPELSSGPVPTHFLALSSNGDVYAWGANTHGQIGDGTITPSFSVNLGVGSIENSRVSGILAKPRKNIPRSYVSNDLPSFRIKPYAPDGVLGSGCEFTPQWVYHISSYPIGGTIDGTGNYLKLSSHEEINSIIEQPKLRINDTVHGKFVINDLIINNSGNNYSNINFIFSGSVIKYPVCNITLTSGSLSSIDIEDGGIFEEIPRVQVVGDGKDADIEISWTYYLNKISCNIMTGGQHYTNNINLKYESMSNTGFIPIHSSGIYAYITGIDVISPGSGYYNCILETVTEPEYVFSSSFEDFPIITSFSDENSDVMVSYPTGLNIVGEKLSSQLNFIYSIDDLPTVDYNINGNTITFSAQGTSNKFSNVVATTHVLEPKLVLSDCEYIATIGNTSLALKRDKTLYFWGAPPNQSFNENENTPIPTPAVPVFTRSALVSIETNDEFNYKPVLINKITQVDGKILVVDRDEIAYTLTPFNTSRTAPYIWSENIDLPREALVSKVVNLLNSTRDYGSTFAGNNIGSQYLGLKITNAGGGYRPDIYTFRVYLKEDPEYYEPNGPLRVPEVSTSDFPIDSKYYNITPNTHGGGWLPRNTPPDYIGFLAGNFTLGEGGSLNLNEKTVTLPLDSMIVTERFNVEALYNDGDTVRAAQFPAEYKFVVPLWEVEYRIVQRFFESGTIREYDGGAIGSFSLVGYPHTVFDPSGAPPHIVYLLQAKDYINKTRDIKPVDSDLLISTIDVIKEDLIADTTGLNLPGVPLLALTSQSGPQYSSTLLSVLSGIAVEKGGYGFDAPPNVKILGETKSTPVIAGQEATAEAIIEGPIEIEIIDGGSNYIKPPVLKFLGTGIPPSIDTIKLNDQGSISSISLKHSGLYNSKPSIILEHEEFKDNVGRSANLQVYLNGSVKYIKLTSSGINYQYAPQIIIDTANNYKATNLYNDLIGEKISINEYEASPYTAIAQSTLARENTGDGGAGFEVKGRWFPGSSPWVMQNITVQAPFPTYDAQFILNSAGCPLYLYTCDNYDENVGFVENIPGSKTLTNNIVLRSYLFPGFWNNDINNDSPDDFIRMIRFTRGVNFDSGYRFYLPTEDQFFVCVTSLKNPKRTGIKYFFENQIFKDIILRNREDDWLRFGDGWDPISGYINTSYYDNNGYEIMISGSGDITFGFTDNSGIVFDSYNNRYSKYLKYNTISNRIDMNGYILFVDDIKWNSTPTIIISDSKGNQLNTSISMNNNCISTIHIENSNESDISRNARIHITNGDILFDQADITALVDYDNKSGITGILINSSGYGYFNNNIHIDIQHNTGSGLEIDVHLDKPGSDLPSSIAAISILSPGENYSENPTIIIQSKDHFYNSAKFIEQLNYELKKINIDNLCYSTKYYEEYVRSEPYQTSLFQTLPNYAGDRDYEIGDRAAYFIRHDGIESFVIGSDTGVLHKGSPKLKIENAYKYYEYHIPELKTSYQLGNTGPFGKFMRYD